MDDRWAWLCPALLALGVAWRWTTLTHLGDYDRFAFGHFAYSDIVHFYLTRDLAAHHLPYFQADVEYPVLTGLLIWCTSWVPTVQGYFVTNALVLCACMLGCLIYLSRMTPSGSLWRFTAAPALALYPVLNWDALALFPMVAALYFARRDRSRVSGAGLALGASAKLFPLFVLPVLAARLMGRATAPHASDGDRIDGRTRNLAPVGALLLPFTAVALALNLPVAVLSPGGWAYFLIFQATRGTNRDSIWAHLPAVSGAVAGVVSALAFLVGIVWVCWRVTRKGGDGWEAGALASLLLFLLFTKDYSPQYDLWLLPFLTMLCCPVWLWLLFTIVDLAYYAAVFLDLYLLNGGHASVSLSFADSVVLGVAVRWREVVLALLFYWAVRMLLEARLPERPDVR